MYKRQVYSLTGYDAYRKYKSTINSKYEYTSSFRCQEDVYKRQGIILSIIVVAIILYAKRQVQDIILDKLYSSLGHIQ